MGFLDMLAPSNPFTSWLDQNRQGLVGGFQGLANASPNDPHALLAGAVNGTVAGSQTDYARNLQQMPLALAAVQRQQAAKWAQDNGHPEWVGPLESGALSMNDIFQQMYKPGTTGQAGGFYIPNPLTPTGGAPSGVTTVSQAATPAPTLAQPSFMPNGSSWQPSAASAAPPASAAIPGMPPGTVQFPPAPAPGYRNNPNGTQSPIPGGPGDPATIGAQISATDRAKASAAKPEQMVSAKNSLDQLSQSDVIVRDFIGKALDLAKNPAATGLIGKASEQIPGTPAYNLSKALDTIRANIGFDKLAQMRQASPSGGALGQVSNFEERLLQSVLGSLDQGQDGPTITANLNRLLDYMAVNDKQRLAAFNADFGGVQNPSGGSPTIAQPSTANLNVTSTGVQWSYAP